MEQKKKNGGARPGAGRKPKAEELKTSELARKALIAKYGSIDASFHSLLDSGEPARSTKIHTDCGINNNLYFYTQIR